jgi:DNA primase
MPGIFDNSIITQIQQANDIVDVISEHVSLKRKGREMVGLCPFHEDHRPSLNVNPAKQIFKCFACGAGGDVFKFVQMRENLSFPQAIERLAERASIRLPAKHRLSAVASAKAEASSISTGCLTAEHREIDRNELARVNAWAAKYFQKNLFVNEKGKFARDYLEKRKITPESIKKWQLGLAIDSPDDLLRQAHDRNIPTKLLEIAGLITNQSQDLSAVRVVDKFINRLMFTITDVTGRIIGFGGRTLSDQGAKYINSPTTVLFDKSNSLYGLEHARHQIVSTDTAVVVEGYTDCIMAHQLGCTNVVASLGTSFTTGQGRILRRYAKKVILVFDSDAAGIEASNRALEVCLSQRLDIKLAFVPEGKDPCDFLLARGKEKFQQLLDNAVDVMQFKWDRLTEKFEKDDTLAGRKAAVDEFLQAIAIGIYAGTLNTIEGGLLVNRLSSIIGLDGRQINAELRKRISASARAAAYDVQSKAVPQIDLGEGLSATAQREILEVLLNEPKLFEKVMQKISIEHFDVPVLRQTAAVLFEAIIVCPEASLREIFAKTDSVEVSSCIMQLQAAGEEKGNFQKRLSDAVDVLLACQARMKIEQIKSRQDPDSYLKSVTETAKKENRRNIGMT